MMASTFIMDVSLRPRFREPRSHPFLGFQIIGFFAMLRDVQPFDFMFFADAEPGKEIGDFQDNQCSDERKAPGDRNADELIANLSPAAIEPPNWFARAEDWIDDLLREDAGEQSPDGAARTVHTERIERVIIAENGFNASDHEVAECARKESDDESGHRADKSRGRRNGDKSGHRSRNGAEGAGFAVFDPFCKAPA